MAGIEFLHGDVKHRCVINDPADGGSVAELIVGTFLNNYTPPDKVFMEAMLNELSTIQSNFTAICLEWFHEIAKVVYYDDRNKASVELGRSISALGLELPHKKPSKLKTAGSIELDYHNGADVERVVSTYLNASWEDYGEFIKQALREYKTLQQTFSRFCLDWFKALTAANPYSKARHVAVAKKALSCYTWLPFI